METLWWQALLGCATILTSVALRFVSFGTARISPDAANIAREALTAASWVFGQSSSCSGQLHHPWRMPTRMLHWHELESKLTDAHDRITNRRFRARVVAIRAELHGIWSERALTAPGVWYAGKVLLPGEVEQEKASVAKAERQLLHAQRGEELIRETKAILARLARRA